MIEDFGSLSRILIFIITAAGAVALFIYRHKFGHLVRNLSVFIDSKRVSSTGINATDYLSIKVRLKRDNVGMVALHDASVRVSWDSGSDVSRLYAIDRLKTKVNTKKKISIEWIENTNDRPLLFAPGEEAEFSCWFTVPSGKVVVIEFSAVAPYIRGDVDQWRASDISLPINEANNAINSVS